MTQTHDYAALQETGTIRLSKARKEFGGGKSFGGVNEGEYIAWWVSHDGTRRLGAVMNSYPTLEACEKGARELLVNPYISQKELKRFREEGGFIYARVIADTDDPNDPYGGAA